jgi:tRNA A-37 threonylcarbamoyl transferase component Bud32
MQKHKFGVMCPYVIFCDPHQAHLSIKNIASTFCTPDAPECTM